MIYYKATLKIISFNNIIPMPHVLFNLNNLFKFNNPDAFLRLFLVLLPTIFAAKPNCSR